MCKGILASVCFLIFLSACKKSDDTAATTSVADATAQSIGDLMAGVDESGGSGGSLSLNSENDLEAMATCFGAGFGSCSSNTITRTFNSCTVGTATFSGTVTLTWGVNASSCSLTATSGTISRAPNFTITAASGATYTVSTTGSYGQRLTWESGTGTSKVFSFTNDGIRRVVRDSSSNVLHDFTAVTSSAITVTGTSRSSRVMNGGTLRLTNNSTNSYCDISPSSVTWSSTCTCASSGTWSGTCSDGASYSLSITGCGTGTLTIGGTSTGVDFDRCAGS